MLQTDGDPERLKCDHPAKLFSRIWRNLSIEDRMPSRCRKEVLRLAHGSHSGLAKTRTLLNELYYWPGMNRDAKTLVEACRECQRYADSVPKQPWKETPCSLPMEKVGVDLFEHGGKQYLAMMNRYTGFLFFAQL